jgi:hypothetical protein
VQLLNGIFVAVIGLWFLGSFVYGVVKALRAPGARPWLALPAGLLLAYGGFGFFAQSAGSMGGLAFVPTSMEFPVWRPESTLRTAGGLTYVGLAPSSRVQVYDAQGRFLRGWFVPTDGKPFRLLPAPNGIRVAGLWMETRYDEQGRPVHGDETATAPTNDLLMSDRPPVDVEWSPLWWPLASPFVAGAVYAIGIAGLYVSSPSAFETSWRRRSQ